MIIVTPRIFTGSSFRWVYIDTEFCTFVGFSKDGQPAKLSRYIGWTTLNLHVK